VSELEFSVIAADLLSSKSSITHMHHAMTMASSAACGLRGFRQLTAHRDREARSATWSGEYLATIWALAALPQVSGHVAAVCGIVGFVVCEPSRA
jgi:hypothetical protein